MTTTLRVHGWISLALLVLGGLMALVFLGPTESRVVVPRPAEDRNVLRVAYTQILLPNPHRRTFPFPANNHFILSLWEPLVECDPATGRPQPAAAQSWAWSPDRLGLTLKLWPDARWSNGDRVTAHDFVRGWLQLLRERTELAENLFPLKNAEAYHRGLIKDPDAVGVHALDDLTLHLELGRIRSTFVAELAEPLLSPLHGTSEKIIGSEAYFKQPEALVTNGPFRLVGANYDGFRLSACEFYHGRSEVRLSGVQFVRVDNLALAPLLVAAGVVDLLSPMPFGETRTMPTDRPVRQDSELVLGVTSIDFNVTRGPLQDLRVRRALALALDRAEVIQEFDPGHMVPARSWVPAMPGREGLAVLEEDAGEARRLLAEAGYPEGKGFPVLNMTLPLWMESDPFPSAWIERWYRVLGVKTHIKYVPQPLLAKRIMSADFDLFYGTLLATVPDAGDLLSTFLQPRDSNHMRWSDSDVISLLNEANTQTGEKRQASLEKAERLVMAAVPTLPVMFERRQAMLAAEVQGWYKDPLARQSLKRLWLAESPEHNSHSEPRL